MTGFINAIPGAVVLGLIWGIMAIGVYLTFRLLDFADLTVDGTIATGGAAFVMSMIAGVNVYVAMLIAFLSGCLAGLATGLLHTVFGIPPILSGILTQIALYSIDLRILGKSNQPISLRKYHLIASAAEINKTIIVVAIFTIILIAVLYWFFGTEVGASIRATGSNLNMARANGININLTKLIALVLSNGIVGLAGGLLAQYQGFADVSMGKGAIVIGLAAVIIGEVIFGKIFKNFALKLLAVVFGGVIYYIVMQFVINLGLNTDDLKLVTAVIVAIFLGIPYIRDKYRQTHVKQKKVKEDK